MKRLFPGVAVVVACFFASACETPTKPVPAGRCATEQECAPSEGFCLSPGAFGGCGICRRPLPSELCTTDAQCVHMGKTAICHSSPSMCLCSGETICTIGCALDSECAEGQACGPTHRCQPKTCKSAANCPTDFVCDGSSCKRNACVRSLDCQGYCVNSGCYATPGTCNLPRP